MFTALLVVALWKFDVVLGVLKTIGQIIFPFILGGAIVFVINVPMSFLEKKIFENIKKENKAARKLARPVSLLLTIVLVIGVIALVMIGVIPQLTKTMGSLMINITDFIPQIKIWIRDFFHDNREIMNLVDQVQFKPDQAIRWGISLLAFTALIPIFGAFIGCAVGSFLIFMVSPKQAIIFIIVFLVLQQIEGNLIYPHVVGESVGLPSIWVLAAVTIGGNLMGIVGMLVFIPLLSVVYTIFRKVVYQRLKKRHIKQVTATDIEEYTEKETASTEK